MDLAALDEQGTRLHELVAARAMGTDESEGHEYLDRTLIPFFLRIIPFMKERPTLTAFDCGQGVAQATLMAFEQGLGTCLLGPENANKIKEHLKLPVTARSSSCRQWAIRREGRRRRPTAAPALRMLLLPQRPPRLSSGPRS
jgi:hypothetical protein